MSLTIIDSGRFRPPRDQKDANGSPGRPFIRLAAGVMPRLPAKVRNIKGRHRVIGPDKKRFAWRQPAQGGFHADHRQGASIAGDVEA